MADDKGTSQLFGESLPGTGGDYIDTNDVEGHMTNKHITPMPPSADGGDGSPEGNRGPGGHIPTLDGTDTEGHRKGPGGNIPNADGSEGGPDDFNNKKLFPGVDGDDTEGHRKGPGGNIPNVDGSADGYRGPGGHIPNVDGSDTEGHRKGPGGNIPNLDGSPDGFNNKKLFPGIEGDDDVEGHGFAKRAPGENPNGDR